MKKILHFLYVVALLTACQTISNSSDSFSGDSNTSFTSSGSDSHTNSNSSSTNSNNSSSSTNSNNSSGTSQGNTTRPDKNPDGSTTLEIASDLNNPINIAEWTNFDFKSSMPTNFKYIYGNNITKPEFYANDGGLKINENSGPKKGFQTAVFNSWIKLEIRINIGSFFNASHTVDKNNPVLTIYGFDSNGLIVSTGIIDNIENTSQNSYVRTYLRNTNICYLEVRATNLPYKSSQVYNFGITGLSLKGWPYE